MLPPLWGIGAARSLRREATEVDVVRRRGTPKRHQMSPSSAVIGVDGVRRRRRRRPAREQDQENLRTGASTCADREPQQGGKTRWLPRRTFNFIAFCLV